MPIFTRFAVLFFLFCTLTSLAHSPALAYNYLYVNKDTGTPIGWEPGTTIEYYLDPGDAGLLTNEQAHILLKEAMRIWEETSYANVPHFVFAGYLSEDVDGSNYQNYVSVNQCYTSDLASCDTEYYRTLKTLIIFDPKDEILDNEFCQVDSCSAYASAKVFDGDFFNRGTFRQGIAVFGHALLISDASDIVGTFVHELGHLLGLAHPSLNQQLYTDSIDFFDDPTVYLASMDTNASATRANLNPDDIAGISALYPTDNFYADLGTIRGTILKADSSPMAHANVIVRNVEDPWCKAYSYISGRRCESSTSQLCEDGGMADGSFSIEGLPPGTYTIEVEGFADSEYARKVSPGLTDAHITGNAEFWNENDAADEDPLAFTQIVLSVGEIRNDIVVTLNNTEYNATYSTMIDANIFGAVTGTTCVANTTDWNALAGIESPTGGSSGNTQPAGGCSLIPY